VPKDEASLGFIDTTTQDSILADKWVVQYLEGCSPWKVLLRHHIFIAYHISRIRGPFGLYDIVSTPHNFHVSNSFIIRSIWAPQRKVAWCSGRCQVFERDGI